jgi:hypothetical protein
MEDGVDEKPLFTRFWLEFVGQQRPAAPMAWHATGVRALTVAGLPRAG